mmetsp:Transcript_26941/g.59292  ORF Transcript_26941/g.59292 Transcript_26941/m.59292 type:complete len:118 (-) Transcript_26941:97-450(-)
MLDSITQRHCGHLAGRVFINCTVHRGHRLPCKQGNNSTLLGASRQMAHNPGPASSTGCGGSTSAGSAVTDGDLTRLHSPLAEFPRLLLAQRIQAHECLATQWKTWKISSCSTNAMKV